MSWKHVERDRDDSPSPKGKGQSMDDFIIRNIDIADGSGKAIFKGDVAWKDGIITAVGDATGHEAQAVIEAKPGWVLSPGFIDTHTHNDDLVFIDHTQWPQLKQGITTEITGSCGVSTFPHSKKYLRALKKYCKYQDIVLPQKRWARWKTYEGYRKDADEHHPLINDLNLVGHGTLRIAVMGMQNREPSTEEMESMKALLREAMDHGAIGMSSGLVYPPGAYADKAELTELCKIVAEYDGVYSTHLRSEGDKLLEALQEAIDIGMESGCKVLISHHKVMTNDYDMQHKAYDMMESARQNGLRIINDQYTYNTGSTALGAMLPPYVLSEIPKFFLSPFYRKRVRKSIETETSWSNYMLQLDHNDIIIIRSDKTPQYQGMSLAKAAESAGVDDITIFFRILIRNLGNTTMAMKFSDMEMVEKIFLSPYTCIGSDGLGAGSGYPAHPRAYANQVRVFSEFVRERHLVSLEEAVRKCTSLPADFLGINKGHIKEGYDADIVIFDPEIIGSDASITDPIREPKGIEYVFVNGADGVIL